MPDLAIVIPTRDRPEFLAGLVSNITETTSTSHRIYLVMEHDDEDTKRAAKNLDTVDVIGDYGSVSHGWNAGYWASEEPFVLVTNDDSRMEQGWDVPALAALGEAGKHICGTNDGQGRMTSFMVARRAFIESRSGVFDAENTLCHGGYASQYVDTEIVDFAKARGVWTEAPESITRHLHHDYGLADPNHPNYVKARAVCADDHALYMRRKPQWEQAARDEIIRVD